MNSPTTEEVTAESFTAKHPMGSEVADAAEPDSAKPPPQSKMEIDADRIRSSIARLTCNSIDELEKLTSELEKLQDFLKSETARVQGEIGSVLAGVGVIVDAIAPWKTVAAANARANGRDKLKRWP